MDEKEVKEIFGIKPQRTKLQNAALHLFFTHISEDLNAAGHTMKDVIAAINLGIPVTPVSAKEVVWKPIMKAMTGKESTTQMDTTNITTVYEAINLAFGERLGVHTPFPTQEQTEAYLDSLKE